MHRSIIFSSEREQTDEFGSSGFAESKQPATGGPRGSDEGQWSLQQLPQLWECAGVQLGPATQFLQQRLQWFPAATSAGNLGSGGLTR